jgi:hypothetical protein
LYSENGEHGEQVPLKTKTTWNKFQKQPSSKTTQKQNGGTRKRRKKKRPAEFSRRQALKQMSSTTVGPTTDGLGIDLVENATDVMVTSTMAAQVNPFHQRFHKFSRKYQSL